MADQKTSDRFRLRVLTPAGLVFEEQVSSVSLPAAEGEIGILPGHIRYTGLLGVGVLQYSPLTSGSERGGKDKVAVVTGGFCNFAEGVLTVLADSVDTPESIDRARLSKEKAEAEKLLSSLSSYDEQWEKVALKVKRSESAERLLGLAH